MANIRTPDPGLKLDLAGKTTYGDYLRLDRLLSAQEPRSQPEHHDELLFIIQHQTSELWMKLLIHELTAARALVREDRLEPSFKILARVGQIQRMLFEQWSVLETLTPSEYLEFRSVLGPRAGSNPPNTGRSSSCSATRTRTRSGPPPDPEVHAWLERFLHEPSLYDEFLRHLARRGLSGAARAARPRLLGTLQSTRVVAVFGPSTPTPSGGGTATRWPRSWWTWRSDSSSGGSVT
jgi:tryptophan 2,3-dioxygenase